MQQSQQPRTELERAENAINSMASAQDLDAFEEYWKEFLRRLERSWNKTIAHYSKSPKWTGWNSPYERARKTDSLLAYLINARGAEEHTVSEITEKVVGGIGINPAFGNALFIKEMSFRNGQLNIRSPMPLRISFEPTRIRLLPVVNRGRTYDTPTTHKGKPIDPDNVIEIAKLGLQFYKETIANAESFFVK